MEEPSRADKPQLFITQQKVGKGSSTLSQRKGVHTNSDGVEGRGEILNEKAATLKDAEMTAGFPQSKEEKNQYNILNNKLFFYIGSPIIQRHLLHLYELLLRQFYKPDTDLMLRQKKGSIFMDIWGSMAAPGHRGGDFLLQNLDSVLFQKETPLSLDLTTLLLELNEESITSLKKTSLNVQPLNRKLLLQSPPFLGKTTSNFILALKDTKGKKKEKHLIRLLKQPLRGHSVMGKKPFLLPIKGQGVATGGTTPFRGFIAVNRLCSKNETIQQPLGSLVCQIYSGLLTKQISKNILVVGCYAAPYKNQTTGLKPSLSTTFKKRHFSQTPSQGMGLPKNVAFEVERSSPKNRIPQVPHLTLEGLDENQIALSSLLENAKIPLLPEELIQAIAGETELKIITDNAYRYAMISRGVAVGMKLLKDVFETLALNSPCLFLIEDIHAIGERRASLLTDNNAGSSDMQTPFLDKTLNPSFLRTKKKTKDLFLSGTSKHSSSFSENAISRSKKAAFFLGIFQKGLLCPHPLRPGRGNGQRSHTPRVRAFSFPSLVSPQRILGFSIINKFSQTKLIYNGKTKDIVNYNLVRIHYKGKKQGVSGKNSLKPASPPCRGHLASDLSFTFSPSLKQPVGGAKPHPPGGASHPRAGSLAAPSLAGGGQRAPVQRGVGHRAPGQRGGPPAPTWGWGPPSGHRDPGQRGGKSCSSVTKAYGIWHLKAQPRGNGKRSPTVPQSASSPKALRQSSHRTSRSFNFSRRLLSGEGRHTARAVCNDQRTGRLIEGEREEIHDKNQVLYQQSKYKITHYRKPYKSVFSNFSFHLFKHDRFNSTPNNNFITVFNNAGLLSITGNPAASFSKKPFGLPAFRSALLWRRGRGFLSFNSFPPYGSFRRLRILFPSPFISTVAEKQRRCQMPSARSAPLSVLH
uniref:Cell division protein n=1 Tax=Haematococcus lacustris TaxID=44745 RepID=A0A2K9YRY5_HAELA|nr:Cell division protein [Haematococcus lacustris]AUW36515.1 Cell division protein [Haematococcus lacustris]